MKKNESLLYFSEAQENEKDNLDIPSAGIARRLLKKYKFKKDLQVIDSSEEEKEVNIAA